VGACACACVCACLHVHVFMLACVLASVDARVDGCANAHMHVVTREDPDAAWPWSCRLPGFRRSMMFAPCVGASMGYRLLGVTPALAHAYPLCAYGLGTRPTGAPLSALHFVLP